MDQTTARSRPHAMKAVARILADEKVLQPAHEALRGRQRFLVVAVAVSLAAASFLVPLIIASNERRLLSEDGVRELFCEQHANHSSCASGVITLRAASADAADAAVWAAAAADALAWAAAAAAADSVCPLANDETRLARAGVRAWASAAAANAASMKARAVARDELTVKDAANATLKRLTRTTDPKPEQLKLYGELRRLSEREDVQFRGFFGHIQMYMHPWIIMILGLLGASLIGRFPVGSASGRIDWRVVFIGGFILFGLVHGPHFARAFMTWTNDDVGRKIVSYVHHDINAWSFWFDQAFFCVICGAVALLCHLWYMIYRAASERDVRVNLTPVVDASRAFSEAFFRWQVESAVLALAFLYLTVVYWRLIWKYQSSDHVVSALLTHALWAIAWAFASLPLKARWDQWQNQRWRAISRLQLGLSFCRPGMEARNAELDLIHKLHPVGVWTVVASVLVAVGSFIAPVLKAITDDI